ncbi:response regulator [Agaribacterium sp. ZY112]|uniref:hybrid sensor histidine kinase/response regulator n=1 Tax=Agaribacterium sp. ZY112 TaxID=3233574 RepID=UPI0035245E79
MSDRVLIIEDTKSFALLLQKLLSENGGFQSDVAYSMAEAEALLQEKAASYFAAIVDLNLPDAPSGEATDIVVARNIPAVVFTSTNDQSLKQDLWDKGIADYASKNGSHSLEYICWIMARLHKNKDVEVLVVDDSLVARKTIKKLLKTQRLTVHEAEDAKQALQVLEKNSDIKVAILDCYMGETSGLELAAKIRESRHRDVFEIIGVSGEDGRALSAQFIKSGADDFLLKPFVPEELLCRVNHAIDRIENYSKLQELNHTKNKLLGTVAHDIRGPVGAIKTAANYIIKRQPKIERQSQLLNMIENSSEALLDLLSDLLDVSAIESGELKLNIENEDISRLIDDRIQLYSSDAESKNMSLNKIQFDKIQANIDSVKIRQVIDNLITNAIKYSPTGSPIEISLVDNNDCFEFCVSDSGPGIKEEEQADLFKAFKVLSSQATGGEKSTGLGLAIANTVVQAHKGKISYKKSRLGGASFQVNIPK